MFQTQMRIDFMKKIIGIFIVLFPFFIAAQWSQNILPRPVQIKTEKGKYKLKSKTQLQIFISPKFDADTNIRRLLRGTSAGKDAYNVTEKETNQPGVWIVKDETVQNPEGYVLKIEKKKIIIRAKESPGVFYALVTLQQSFPDNWEYDTEPFFVPDFKFFILSDKLKCATITDAPAFSWRGLHLDVSRHFFTVDDIKQYLDLMAYYKLNTFHWHLTDDQGWRIQIDKYPELTNTGAWRNGSMVGPYKNHQVDSIRYGGFYTKQQIRDVVEYARQRFITVVPEIEMPGHSLAAVAAYPWLSCTGNKQEVAKIWGGFPDVYCPGKDSVFEFVQNVLSEVMELFPSKYIHIGGDECEKTRWKTCPKCQARIASEGLKDEYELQSYFIRRVEKFLNENNRNLIGWDEILEGGLAPNAAVMSWRGEKGGIEAARQGHAVVMSPGKPLYFDHYQRKDPAEPHAIGGYNPLEAVFSYNPLPDSLTTAQKKLILGAQGNVWTEYMTNWQHVQYMVWPRAIALSDALWHGGDRKDFADFLPVLKRNTVYLDVLKVNYAPHFKNKDRKKK